MSAGFEISRRTRLAAGKMEPRTQRADLSRMHSREGIMFLPLVPTAESLRSGLKFFQAAEENGR